MKPRGHCALCKESDKDLVASHVIPRSFYREYGKGNLLETYGTSSLASARGKRVRTGIYGHFLCSDCENKFCEIDDKAANLLLREERIVNLQMLADAPNVGFRGIPLSRADQSHLHLFAASLLWRAAHSKREEFAQVKIGDKYDLAISNAIRSKALDDDLSTCIGVVLSLYDKAEPLNGAAIVAQKGRFNTDAWGAPINFFQLGFPYGNLWIRLDQRRPNQGYFSFDGLRAALWSCNVSVDYPVWCVASPALRHDFNDIVNLVKQTARMAKS